MTSSAMTVVRPLVVGLSDPRGELWRQAVALNAPTAVILLVNAANAAEIRSADIRVGRGQTKLEPANPDDVVQCQLLAAARLGFPVDPNLLCSQKPLSLGAALDHPGQLQQLAERDRRPVNLHIALDRGRLATPTHLSHVERTLPYDGGRQVTAYVPPAFPEAVVFAGDGQLIASWGDVSEAEGLPPTMIVGAHRHSDETRRIQEYSPGEDTHAFAFDPQRFAAHERFFVDVVMTERPGAHGGRFWKDEFPSMVAWAFER